MLCLQSLENTAPVELMPHEDLMQQFGEPAVSVSSTHALEMKKTKPEVFLDHYLSTIGLWRKPVARDGLSLFRAVSEQLFMTQLYHTNLYEACRTVFYHLNKDPETEWTEYWIMKILSRMYRRDFLVYEAVGEPPVVATFNNYEEKIVLCRVDEHQLDSVYPLTFQNSAAVCQSIVYEVLYRGVFKLDAELTEAVNLIRNENKRKMSLLSSTFEDLQDTCIPKLHNLHICFKNGKLRKPSPPLPYRIAKALDPYIYRNVELDIWEEEVRDQKKESKEYRMRFTVGDKCGVILEGCHYRGHIQELSDQENTAVVFVEELGEKQVVQVSCLKTLSPKYSIAKNKFYKRKQDYISHYQPDYSEHLTYHNTSPQKLYPVDTIPTQGTYFPQGTVCNSLAMTNGNTGYIGMETSPVQTIDNVNKNNINHQPALAYQQYGQPMTAYPQGNMSTMTTPYMYNNTTTMMPQSYTCMMIPHLESIPVQSVNMNCIPSQDTGGKDLPDVNTVRFFYNLGVENYRQISGPRWPCAEMGGVMGPGGMVMADQLNGNVPVMPAHHQHQAMTWASSDNPGAPSSYPSAMPCPVYFTNPTGPGLGAHNCMPPAQVPAGTYMAAQNPSMIPQAMPVHTVQMAQ